MDPADNIQEVPPVPIKTYRWEDVKRARASGAYPWTHLTKPPLEGEEITGEDVLRETTPRRSMSRDASRERSAGRSPTPHLDHPQPILNLNASPGSGRKGTDEGINIPNFSKEVSLDSTEGDKPAADDPIRSLVDPEALNLTVETKINVSPKGILKRKHPKPIASPSEESPRNSKCCHPFVEKIKHIADKTLHKTDKSPVRKNVTIKREVESEPQEILELESSPGSERRQKRTAEESSPPTKSKKTHIYEDVNPQNDDVKISFNPETIEELLKNAEADENRGDRATSETKSGASLDPSLQIDEDIDLEESDHVMHLMRSDKFLEAQKEAEEKKVTSYPNVTITDVTDEVEELSDSNMEIVEVQEEAKEETEESRGGWSEIGDHEYEPIGKPQNESIGERHAEPKTGRSDDDVSSTTSQERRYLQGSLNDVIEHRENEDFGATDDVNLQLAEKIQKEIEDRYLINTPTMTESRTDCEISTSQVDSSALENLPLKRGSRNKFSAANIENTKQRFRTQTTKLRSQADKLKTKIKNMKRPQFNMPERAKTERHKFTLPERPKFSLLDKPKIKIRNFSEKFTGPDRPKFSFPDRPKFSLPDRAKFKFPDRAKINFSALRMHNKETRSNEDPSASIESEPDNKKKSIDFDFRKYPRMFNRTKKEKEKLVISSPIVRADTPTPPEFATVPRMKHRKPYSDNRWDDTNRFNDEPRNYGKHSLRNVHETVSDISAPHYQNDINDAHEQEKSHGLRQFTNQQQTVRTGWQEEQNNEDESISREMGSHSKFSHDVENQNDDSEVISEPHRFGVIEEINKDEFFLRKKGISEENIDVGRYISEEIRDAFRLPVNALNQMDEQRHDDDDYLNSDGYLQETLDKSYAESIEERDVDDSHAMEENDDGYYTFPPVRPKRAKKLKKRLEKSMEYIDDSFVETLPKVTIESERYDAEEDFQLPPRVEINDPTTDLSRFGYLQDGLDKLNEYENEIEQPREPPVAPKRTKKFTKNISCFETGSIADEYIKDDWSERAPESDVDDIIVHRIEHEYTVPCSPEDFITEPPVAPVRKRSRSRGSRGSCATSAPDDDRTSRGAESLTLDIHPPAATSSLSISEHDLVAASRDSPKYATVDKYSERKHDIPPRPSAPIRRQRSAKSLGTTNQFFTVPGRLRDGSPPKRPHRNYSTLGPSRPPRKKSTTSLITLDKIRRDDSLSDFTQYVEIEDDGMESHRNLQTGEIVNKMKDRPLPPPPVPPRGQKKSRDFEDNGEIKEVENITLTSSASLPTEQEPTRQKLYETEEVVEIEVSTQTDPLPSDLNFELSDDEPLEDQKVIFPRLPQDAEAKLTASHKDDDDAEILARGLQKFRESSRPSSRSGGGGTPSNRPKTPTGRISPTAILVERRISSPTRINHEDQVVTTASLTVQPIDDVETKPFESLTPLKAERRQIIPNSQAPSNDVELLRTQRLHVSNLDVGSLNVSELQAHKLLVSEIQALSLRADPNSNSSNIVVSGIELAPAIIDEIVQKFSQILADARPNVTPVVIPDPAPAPVPIPAPRRREVEMVDVSTSHVGECCEEETQTECDVAPKESEAGKRSEAPEGRRTEEQPPQRPPPPFYPYLQEFSLPSTSFYRLHSPAMERPFTDFYQGDNLPGPMKRRKARPSRDSSSEKEEYRPPSRRPHHRSTEPSVAELGSQLMRACQTSITRTVRGMLNYIMEHFTGRDGKKDVQMALVIFLVLIAGVIMLSVGDGRTVHHHHWEFFNPPTDPNA